jgi:hypothetical protein
MTDMAGLGYLNGYAMLKEKYCIPPLDQAYSALLEDLAQRELLEETLVVMVGEFGRTPWINKTLGREHGGCVIRQCWPAEAHGTDRCTGLATPTPLTSRTSRSPPKTCWPQSTLPLAYHLTQKSTTESIAATASVTANPWGNCSADDMVCVTTALMGSSQRYSRFSKAVIRLISRRVWV